MKKIILILFIIPLAIFAQGFDWQYSDRMPFEMPTSFVGAYLQFANGNFSNPIALKEGEEHCCDLANGINSNYGIGASSDFFIEDGLFDGYGSAISVSLGYSQASQKFNRLQSVPKDVNKLLVTMFESETDIQQVNLKIAWKNRIPDYFVYFEIGLWSDYKLSEANSYIEKVVSPSNYDFGNGETSRSLNGTTDKIKQINFGLFASIGYDLNLGLGKYLSPFIEIYPPLLSNFENEKNALFQYKLGTKILFAL